jgi:hypothetical protein
MKGTIDPVEAIFTAVSGLWGRVFSFLGACWVGYAFGIVAADATWTKDFGLQLAEASRQWSFVPIAWIFSCGVACLKWWGLPHLLVLIVVGYRLILSEANICLSICVLFLMEAWLWWTVEIFYFYYDFESWHPLFYVMALLSAGALWLGWRTWKNEHPVEKADDFPEIQIVPAKKTDDFSAPLDPNGGN